MGQIVTAWGWLQEQLRPPARDVSLQLDPSSSADREVLLVEYQKAQDSAEHHDNLVGSVTSLWLGSAVLIGFVVSASDHAVHQYRLALILLTLFGMFLTLLVLSWASRAGNLKLLKYTRCQEIEEMLGMVQHRRVPKRRPWQDHAYMALLGLLFAVWIVLLVNVA